MNSVNTYLEHAQPAYVAIEVRSEVERALPRFESALVHAWDEVGRRIDQGGLLVAPLRQQLEARVEEVPPHERGAISGGQLERRV